MTDKKPSLIEKAHHLLTCDELRGRVPQEVQQFLRDVVALEPLSAEDQKIWRIAYAVHCGIRDTAPPADPGKASEPDLHPKTADLVNRFARALAEKLSAAEKKYGYSDGWSSPDWMDECRAKLITHVYKGDPRDVAAYCAFLWHHGSHTNPRSPFCEKCGSAEACDCTTTAKASGSAPEVTARLRRAAERTRDDLGPTGTNYPDVRVLLAFAEAAIALLQEGKSHDQ